MRLGALQVNDRELRDLCLRHGVERLQAFGSVLRDDFGPESDVDLLVHFKENVKPGLSGLISLQQDLEALLGRRVDLAEPSQLKWVIRDRVLEEARLVFAA